MAKTLAAQVRNILRETGAAKYNALYTNRYKNCRTVKAYAPEDNDLILDVAEKIEMLCDVRGIKFQMKVLDRGPGYYRSIIVRLPLEN